MAILADGSVECGLVEFSTVITTVNGPGNDVGFYTSIAVPADGLPVISYYEYTALALKVAKCATAGCS